MINRRDFLWPAGWAGATLTLLRIHCLRPRAQEFPPDMIGCGSTPGCLNTHRSLYPCKVGHDADA